jgi:hypothetical protein
MRVPGGGRTAPGARPGEICGLMSPMATVQSARDLPDRSHVEVIRRALRGTKRRAAVMVGTGFSRKAEPLATVTAPMALWSDVIREVDRPRDETLNHIAEALGVAPEDRETY